MATTNEALAENKLCRDCGELFRLTQAEQAFFQRRGLQQPQRCKACRLERRQRDQESA